MDCSPAPRYVLIAVPGTARRVELGLHMCEHRHSHAHTTRAHVQVCGSCRRSPPREPRAGWAWQQGRCPCEITSCGSTLGCVQFCTRDSGCAGEEGTLLAPGQLEGEHGGSRPSMKQRPESGGSLPSALRVNKDRRVQGEAPCAGCGGCYPRLGEGKHLRSCGVLLQGELSLLPHFNFFIQCFTLFESIMWLCQCGLRAFIVRSRGIPMVPGGAALGPLGLLR